MSHSSSSSRNCVLRRLQQFVRSFWNLWTKMKERVGLFLAKQNTEQGAANGLWQDKATPNIVRRGQNPAISARLLPNPSHGVTQSLSSGEGKCFSWRQQKEGACCILRISLLWGKNRSLSEGQEMEILNIYATTHLRCRLIIGHGKNFDVLFCLHKPCNASLSRSPEEQTERMREQPQPQKQT